MILMQPARAIIPCIMKELHVGYHSSTLEGIKERMLLSKFFNVSLVGKAKENLHNLEFHRAPTRRTPQTPGILLCFLLVWLWFVSIVVSNSIKWALWDFGLPKSMKQGYSSGLEKERWAITRYIHSLLTDCWSPTEQSMRQFVEQSVHPQVPLSGLTIATVT
jgi:hypothetical protein